VLTNWTIIVFYRANYLTCELYECIYILVITIVYLCMPTCLLDISIKKFPLYLMRYDVKDPWWLMATSSANQCCPSASPAAAACTILLKMRLHRARLKSDEPDVRCEAELQIKLKYSKSYETFNVSKNSWKND